MFRLSVLFRSPITSELSFIHIIFAFLVVLLFGGFLEFLGAYLFSVFVILDHSILVINLVYLKWMLGLFMQCLYLYHRDNILFYLQINLFSLLSCFLSEIQKLWKRRTCGLDSLVKKIFLLFFIVSQLITAMSQKYGLLFGRILIFFFEMMCMIIYNYIMW